ncbi:hypothetical protein LTS08_006144 [Lithohypha guttulata]|uniref:uncharacterized protein n=1 Tax=Lithohypha guttulata TaxID=1690604 RepID=UPI002DDEAF08|nr:hypothetical protein LTR51_002853 [Lithohypha guttulata]KAK5098766.1 hypothetical protein LTS08_006144 [Lithohypha guttulata]
MKFSTVTLLSSAIASTSAFGRLQTSTDLSLPLALSVSIFHTSLTSAYALPNVARSDEVDVVKRHGRGSGSAEAGDEDAAEGAGPRQAGQRQRNGGGRNRGGGDDDDDNDDDDDDNAAAAAGGRVDRDGGADDTDDDDDDAATGRGAAGDNDDDDNAAGQGRGNTGGNNIDGLQANGTSPINQNSNSTGTSDDPPLTTGTPGSAVGVNATAPGSGSTTKEGTLPAGFPPPVPGEGFLAGEGEASGAGSSRAASMARREFRQARQVVRRAPTGPKNDLHQRMYDI